jgi:penicillin-binding protein 1A
MSDMMSGVVTFGTAYPYGTVKNEKGEIIQTAGKTGTTSDNRDKWFVGFSSYYVGATWYGYDKNYEIPDGVERSQALNLWQQVMLRVHKNLAPKSFEKPTGIVEKNIAISSGKVPSDLTLLDPRNPPNVPNSVRYGEYFIKGTEPKDNDPDDVHVKVRVCTEGEPDAFGRYPLATEYCPESTVIEKVMIKRSRPFVPKSPDDPYPLDWAVEVPTEKCSIHTSPQSSTKPEQTPKGTSTPKATPIPTPTPKPKGGR